MRFNALHSYVIPRVPLKREIYLQLTISLLKQDLLWKLRKIYVVFSETIENRTHIHMNFPWMNDILHESPCILRK